MSKLINAPSSRARRRSGRSLVARWAIASAGASGLNCEYRAEILTDRYNREKLRVFPEQIRVTRCIFISLVFAHNSFAQNIHGEADFFCPPLAQCRYDFMRISSR